MMRGPDCRLPLGIVVAAYVFLGLRPSLAQTNHTLMTGRALEYSNEKGDTVWFDRLDVPETEHQFLTPSGWRSSGLQLSIVARAVSTATPLLIVAPWTTADTSAQLVAERVMAASQLPMTSTFRPEEPTSQVMEPGFLGPRDHPDQFGWELVSSPLDTSRVRLIFVTVGWSDSTTALEADRSTARIDNGQRTRVPQPRFARRGRYQRFHEIDREDRLATLRVLGEVHVDLGSRSIVRDEPTQSRH